MATRGRGARKYFFFFREARVVAWSREARHRSGFGTRAKARDDSTDDGFDTPRRADPLARGAPRHARGAPRGREKFGPEGRATSVELKNFARRDLIQSPKRRSCSPAHTPAATLRRRTRAGARASSAPLAPLDPGARCRASRRCFASPPRPPRAWRARAWLLRLRVPPRSRSRRRHRARATTSRPRLHPPQLRRPLPAPRARRAGGGVVPRDGVEQVHGAVARVHGHRARSERSRRARGGGCVPPPRARRGPRGVRRRRPARRGGEEQPRGALSVTEALRGGRGAVRGGGGGVGAPATAAAASRVRRRDAQPRRVSPRAATPKARTTRTRPRRGRNARRSGRTTRTTPRPCSTRRRRSARAATARARRRSSSRPLAILERAGQGESSPALRRRERLAQVQGDVLGEPRRGGGDAAEGRARAREEAVRRCDEGSGEHPARDEHPRDRPPDCASRRSPLPSARSRRRRGAREFSERARAMGRGARRDARRRGRARVGLSVWGRGARVGSRDGVAG